MKESQATRPETLGEKVKKWSGRIGTSLGVTLLGGATCSGLINLMNHAKDESRIIRLIEKELKPQMDAIRDGCRRILLKDGPDNSFMPEDCDRLNVEFTSCTNRRERTNHFD